ncbi:membrane protein insertase YidC [Parvularcula marina]|uniref:membrane protein insertase YidC n=1 Tax=Parvularcula marina TaxID=2292771 RepID=UPI003513ECA1
MDRNLILALVLSMLIIFGYQALIVGPKQKAWKEAEAARQAAIEAQGPSAAASGNPDILAPSTAEVGREEALSTAPGRVLIKTDELEGSINLRGLVFDDLKLSEYKLTLDPDSPPMTLLSPRNSPHAQFMRSGLQINGQPDASVVWSAPQDAVLTLETPVTFTRTQGDIEHEVTISVDEHFMFTFTQTVRNGTDAPATVQGYAGAFQKGIPPDLKNMMMLYEGPVGVVQGDIIDRKYKNVLKKGPVLKSGVGGWIGLTDKYKLAAVIPPQDMPFRADIKSDNAAVTPTFQSTYLLDPQTVPAGGELTMTSHLFGGAKEVKQLREYENNLGIDRFDEAVDWGNILWLLTRGIFAVLSFFHGLVGNWGVAILLLTLVIKAILFPLANLSYKSMAGMKKVQPELKKVQERYKDDKAKQQQEMMALYKKYKINPAAGCLPILAQMPIFFALYKTLFVTTELRHEPFLYIKDLAERDPTSIFNLFGLLPYDPLSVPVIGSFLGLGILPLLMGAAMYVQTKLNPPPTDDTQKLIFGLMPLIFMFIFAPFAAGLVLYWFWNTFLSVLQQYVIMKRQGADVDILGNIKASFGKSPDAANENKAK